MSERFNFTDQAKNIFGDIVEYAYCEKPNWSTNFKTPFVTDERIEPEECYPVFIQFTNGKSIELWSSEWGGVRVKSEEEYLKEVHE